MPVFRIRRNHNGITRIHFYGILAPFLVIAAPADTEQQLSPAFCCLMDVPVIPAAGFKGDIRQSATQRGQPALSVKILCIGIVGLSDGKLDRFLVVGFGIVFGPDVFREPECSPGFGPSGIKGCMRNEFCDFSSCDTVVFRVLQMMGMSVPGPSKPLR